LKAYLDNNVVSSIVKDDILSQSDALSRLLEAGDLGKVQLVTSEITLEEIKRVPSKHRPPLERTFRLLEKVPVVRWEELIFITNDGSGNNWPVIEKDPLYRDLLALGLEITDSRHLFVATKQSCDVFLTCDNTPRTGILRRAVELKTLCGVLVQRPSEFVAANGW
jgi:predicted nucleic acid-binding protein